MKIAIIVTNYNNTAHTVNLCESVFNVLNAMTISIDVIVVDNDSNAEEKELLLKSVNRYSFLKVILNDSNMGYFKGLNAGLKFIDASNYDFVVIGNNDLIFDIDSFKSLENCSQEYPVLCPDITTLDGIHQNPHVIKPLTVIREIIYDIYFVNYSLSVFMMKVANRFKRFFERKDYQSYLTSSEIYQGYGACYILTKKFFEICDSLWSPTFLMGEEYFLSRQLSEHGYSLYYDANIKVKHVDHASISSIPEYKFWLISKDSHKVYRKYVGWFGERNVK